MAEACCGSAGFAILEDVKSRAMAVLALLAFPASLFLARAAAADEIRLKDGTKIIGTIVGYENESFKVQTSYGFAFVRKDKVAAIIPSEPKPDTVLETEKSAATKKHEPKDATDSRAAASAASSGAAESGARAATSAPATTPPAPPSPPPMREEVQGNLYINHAYGFHLYKPPSWRVIEGAQMTLPAAIVAMGTGDETTLLVIAREPLKDSLETQATATEKQLREIYTNYRELSGHHTHVAGLPAIERRYRGTVDGHDWSGVVLALARGNDVFTILGMTYADSDLIQIQENVIAKTIASLEFTAK